MNSERPSGDADSSMRTIGPLNKGLGPMDRPMSTEEIAAQKWNLLADDLSLPAAVLDEEKLKHNLRWMQQFIEAYGARLAPHGKTSMAPRLFAMQLQSGAWGITMATAHQARVAYAHGVRRVLMANQLVGRQNMEIVASLVRDPQFDYFCLVDSAENVNRLGQFFEARGLKLQVLLEVGMEDGRAGVRNTRQRQAVLAELSRWKETIVLRGVEVYEGICPDESVVRAFLQSAIESAKEIVAQGAIARSPMILSGAGSAWFDVVAEIFSQARVGCATEVVLRPGCYLTHDVGAYKKALERIVASNSVARRMNATLQPALRIWAYVHSVPEATKAIVGLGRRDAAFDSGLPTPALYVPQGSNCPVATPAHWKLTRIMDQHAYLEIAAGDSIHVGDKMAFDISHPCLTFDKWRYLPVVDANYTVVDVVETFF
ncbi:MAG: amino acid deaminase [Terracidiphilus sp.]